MANPFGGDDKLSLLAFDGRDYVLYRSTWE